MTSILICAAWLSISTVTDKLGVAPELPPLVLDGLPLAVDTDAGTLLPPELARAVKNRMVACDGYRGLCQVALDELARFDAISCDSQRSIDAAKCDRSRLVEPVTPSFDVFDLAFVGLSGLGIGVGIGALFGR